MGCSIDTTRGEGQVESLTALTYYRSSLFHIGTSCDDMPARNFKTGQTNSKRCNVSHDTDSVSLYIAVVLYYLEELKPYGHKQSTWTSRHLKNEDLVIVPQTIDCQYHVTSIDIYDATLQRHPPFFRFMNDRTILFRTGNLRHDAIII